MKPQTCFIKGLRFLSIKKNLHLTLLIGIVLTVAVTVYVLVSQRQSLNSVISTNKEQQNRDLINTDSEPFTLKLTAQQASPSKQKDVPHRTYLITRTRCTQSVFLLIMVLTAPANFDGRTVIRKTWATDPSMKVRWKTVFLLGQDSGNSTQNKYLEAEGLVYRDLIRGAQNDHYDNLTLKTQMGLEWAAKYCDFQFLLKADDDVFVNPHNLIDYLKKPDIPVTNLYMGRCFHDAPSLRIGKHGVTNEEYNTSTYPNYCNGPAYLLSSDLVFKVVELFDVKKPFKLEGVYIGMLIKNIGGLEPVRHPGFRTQQLRGPCKYIPDMFVYHKASIECLQELFRNGTSERFKYELTKLRRE